MTQLDEEFEKQIKDVEKKIPENSKVIGKQFSNETLKDTALIVRTFKGEIENISL